MSSSGVGMGTRGAIALGLAAVALLAVSCEFPFALRDSEHQTGTSIRIDLTTDPGLVRGNIWRCYIKKEPSPYSEQLSDDFVFVTDPVDAAELEQTYAGDYSEWNGKTDKDLTAYLLNDSRCNLVLCIPKDDEDDECLPDSTVQETTETLCTIQYSYKFTFVLYSARKHVAGEARFYMRKEPKDNLWRMYKWEDIKPQSAEGDTITFGMLKGETLATW